MEREVLRPSAGGEGAVPMRPLRRKAAETYFVASSSAIEVSERNAVLYSLNGKRLIKTFWPPGRIGVRVLPRSPAGSA